MSLASTTPTPPASTARAARPPMKPLDEALAELLPRALPLPGFETVSTFDADEPGCAGARQQFHGRLRRALC